MLCHESKISPQEWVLGSAAASILLGLNPVDASTGDLPNVDEAKRGDGDPFPPLILEGRPGASGRGATLRGTPFAFVPQLARVCLLGRRRGASISRFSCFALLRNDGWELLHSAGSSGTGDCDHSECAGGNAAAVRRATPVYPNGFSATPAPQQVAPYVPPVIQKPIRIELTNGAAIYGVFWSNRQPVSRSRAWMRRITKFHASCSPHRRLQLSRFRLSRPAQHLPARPHPLDDHESVRGPAAGRVPRCSAHRR